LVRPSSAKPPLISGCVLSVSISESTAESDEEAADEDEEDEDEEDEDDVSLIVRMWDQEAKSSPPSPFVVGVSVRICGTDGRTGKEKEGSNIDRESFLCPVLVIETTIIVLLLRTSRFGPFLQATTKKRKKKKREEQGRRRPARTRKR